MSTYRYDTATIDFATNDDVGASLETEGRTDITVTVTNGGTGSFDLEYTPDGSTWVTWKSYSSTGDVDETVEIAARAVRLKTTAGTGTGSADTFLAASD